MSDSDIRIWLGGNPEQNIRRYYVQCKARQTIPRPLAGPVMLEVTCHWGYYEVDTKRLIDRLIRSLCGIGFRDERQVVGPVLWQRYTHRRTWTEIGILPLGLGKGNTIPIEAQHSEEK